MLKHYDVTIIGGGVQGCAVAQACAAAKLKTLLIEKDCWGSATSSASSKLIHGGLRYLETGQFRLVRESLSEREWMIRHIPDLVKPNWFYIPVYHDSHLQSWKIFAGLSLYKTLAGFVQHSQFRRVPKTEWHSLDGIRLDGLKTVFAYQDAQTDDKALTECIAKSAMALGADCHEHSQLTRAARFENGYRVCYRHQQGAESCVASTVVVNATGPWVNQTLACFSPQLEPLPIDLVQGSHIIIRECLSNECFYLQAPSDKRAIFVMPWKGRTMIGTTEKAYTEMPGKPSASQQEIDYLCETFRYYFPGHPVDIIDTFSGIRVLPEAGNSYFNRPRDMQIHQQDKLLSLYGGKLTGWRLAGEKTLGIIQNLLGTHNTIDTRDIPLPR